MKSQPAAAVGKLSVLWSMGGSMGGGGSQGGQQTALPTARA